ncbi:MAG: hypothetical protein F4187_00345 [Gemmatimonadetes bacterium]|nr:hypothetical protein [Gemmatimonadota bacterium]
MAPEPAMAYYALFDLDTGRPVWEGSFQGAHEYRILEGAGDRLYYLPFDIWPAAIMGRDGFFLTLGENQGPEILEYDLSGGLRRIIRLAEAVVAPSREQIGKLVEFRLAPWDPTPEDRELFTEVQLGDYAEMPLPEIMPVFSRLLVDDVGWLWAELYRFDVRAPKTWLVFDPNGEGHGSVDMPPDLDVRQIGRDFVLGCGLTNSRWSTCGATRSPGGSEERVAVMAFPHEVGFPSGLMCFSHFLGGLGKAILYPAVA